MRARLALAAACPCLILFGVGALRGWAPRWQPLIYPAEVNLGHFHTPAVVPVEVTVANVSPQPVSLESISVTCGCTTVLEFPRCLAGQASGSIRLEIDLRSQAHGHKTVRLVPIIADSAGRRALSPMRLELEYEDLVTITPSRVAFEPPFLRDAQGAIYLQAALSIRHETANIAEHLTADTPFDTLRVASIRSVSPNEATLILHHRLPAHAPRNGDLALVLHSPLADVDLREVPVSLEHADPITIEPPVLLIGGVTPGQRFTRSVSVASPAEGVSPGEVLVSEDGIQARWDDQGVSHSTVTVEGSVPERLSEEAVVSVEMSLRFASPHELIRDVAIRFAR